jgi:uncharacterized protein (UPF0332 family)
MTDKETLFMYRLEQAEETLSDAKKMLDGDFSSRSVTNRAYYSMFYAILALFLKTDVHIKTSKHKGVISIFDKEFILTGKLNKYYSEILHKLFNVRQKGDYKELVEISHEDAAESVKLAEEFLEGIKKFLQII